MKTTLLFILLSLSVPVMGGEETIALSNSAAADDANPYSAWRNLKQISNSGFDRNEVACISVASNGGALAAAALASYTINNQRRDRKAAYDKYLQKEKSINEKGQRLKSKIDDLHEMEKQYIEENFKKSHKQRRLLGDSKRKKRRNYDRARKARDRMLKKEHALYEAEAEKFKRKRLEASTIRKQEKGRIKSVKATFKEELDNVLGGNGLNLKKLQKLATSQGTRRTLKSLPIIGFIVGGAMMAYDSYNSSVQAAITEHIHDTLSIDTAKDSTLGPFYINDSVQLAHFLAMDEDRAFSIISDSPALQASLPKMLKDTKSLRRHGPKMGFNKCSQ